MVRRYQIRLMRSVNARCVSIGLVLALSNCSESGGEPDAMLDMHHPGTGIDSHHPQFHNSYGNMKFIIIVINPLPSKLVLRATQVTAIGPRARARSASQVLDVFRGAFLFTRPPPVLFATVCSKLNNPSPTTRQTSFAFVPPRTSSAKRNGTHVRWRIILPFLLPFRLLLLLWKSRYCH